MNRDTDTYTNQHPEKAPPTPFSPSPGELSFGINPFSKKLSKGRKHSIKETDVSAEHHKNPLISEGEELEEDENQENTNPNYMENNRFVESEGQLPIETSGGVPPHMTRSISPLALQRNSQGSDIGTRLELPFAISDLTCALERSNYTTQNLKEQLEFVLNRECSLRSMYETLEDKYEDLKGSLDIEKEDLRRERVEGAEKLHTLIAAQKHLKASVIEKQTEINGKVEEIFNLKEIIEEIKREKLTKEENLERKMVGSNTKIDELEKVIEKMENNKRTYGTNIEKMSDDIFTLEKENSTLKEKLKTINLENSAYEEDLESLSHELQKIKDHSTQKLLSQEREAQQLKSKITNLEGKLLNSDTQISGLNYQISNLAKSQTQSNKETNSLKSYMSEVKKNIKQESELKTELVSKYEQLLSEFESLQSLQNTLQKTLENKDTQILELSTKSEKIVNRLEELKSMEGELRKEYQHMKEECKSAKSNKESQEWQLSTLKEENKKLYNQLKMQEGQKNKELAGIREEYEEKCSQLGDELNITKMKSCKMELTLQKLGNQRAREDEEKRSADIEVNQWKEAFLELATLTIKEDTHKIQSSLDIDMSLSEVNRLPHIVKVIHICKSILSLSSIHCPETLTSLKATLTAEKKKYLELHQKYFSEMRERRKLHNYIQDLKGNIRVMCRIRPMLAKERKKLTPAQLKTDCISSPEEHLVSAYTEYPGRTSTFEFDRVFMERDTQDMIYEEVSPLLVSALDGYNICIMAYGQTGSGKTYTMDGGDGGIEGGVVQRALADLFALARDRVNSRAYEYTISMSIVEIYNQQVRNLLSPKVSNLEIMENQKGKILVVGEQKEQVWNLQEAMKLIEVGTMNRSVGRTNVNEFSSRSHSIITIHIKGKNKELQHKIKSSMNLIDLAGSERAHKSETNGERLKEALHINQSLTSLGKTLTAIGNKDKHVPYRDSKLTHILKESLGGDSKILMVIQINPNPNDLPETISTLNFGSRVALIEKGKIKPNITKSRK